MIKRKLNRKLNSAKAGLINMSITLTALVISGSAWAHHSFAAAYNMENAITIIGKVVDVRLTNPHSHFFLEVENEDGSIANWKFEAGTPSGMIRNGYSTEVIKDGDTVSISGFRARDNSDNGMMTELVTSDGTVYGMFGPRDNSGGR